MRDTPLVRFYVLAQNNAPVRYRLVCQLAEKALAQAQSVFILCADDAMLKALDTMLWQYPAAAFLPHCHHEATEAAQSPILLATSPARASRCDVFINLSLEHQADIPRGCQRVFEIVHQEVATLAATRARFQAYRERELNPETHKLGENQA